MPLLHLVYSMSVSVSQSEEEVRESEEEVRESEEDMAPPCRPLLLLSAHDGVLWPSSSRKVLGQAPVASRKPLQEAASGY